MKRWRCIEGDSKGKEQGKKTLEDGFSRSQLSMHNLNFRFSFSVFRFLSLVVRHITQGQTTVNCKLTYRTSLTDSLPVTYFRLSNTHRSRTQRSIGRTRPDGIGTAHRSMQRAVVAVPNALNRREEVCNSHANLLNLHRVRCFCFCSHRLMYVY
jgi:hypothetical protein